MPFRSSKPGFTLTELLIVIGILILIAGISAFTASGWRTGQAHAESQDMLRDAIRQARQYAEQNRNDESWIVSLATDAITVTGAQSNELITYDLPSTSSLAWQGSNVITFVQPFGFPNSATQVTVTTGNVQSSYLINVYGILAQQ